MKKTLLFLAVHLVVITSATAQLYFDKKMRKLDSPINARYKAIRYEDRLISKIMLEPEGRIYAEGIIFPADTLTFDGKVEFFDPQLIIKSILFYKKGILQPTVAIDQNLKKTPQTNSPFYLIAGDNGEFAAYRKKVYTSEKNDIIIATGKIVDTVDLILDSTITYYNNMGSIRDVKIYKKGQELPFFATTTDYKAPYEIINIVTHSAIAASSIEREMEISMIKCKQTGADGVIGIHTSIAATELYTHVVIQGTAIKLKK